MAAVYGYKSAMQKLSWVGSGYSATPMARPTNRLPQTNITASAPDMTPVRQRAGGRVRNPAEQNVAGPYNRGGRTLSSAGMALAQRAANTAAAPVARETNRLMGGPTPQRQISPAGQNIARMGAARAAAPVGREVGNLLGGSQASPMRSTISGNSVQQGRAAQYAATNPFFRRAQELG